MRQLQEAVEQDLTIRKPKSKSHEQEERSISDALTHQQSWVLKEEAWVMTADFDVEEKEEDVKHLSSAALALQRSATSQLERENTHHLHLRLNSHLMELSMKAEEAVEAIGKGRFVSSRDVRKAATRSRTFSTDINAGR